MILAVQDKSFHLVCTVITREGAAVALHFPGDRQCFQLHLLTGFDTNFSSSKRGWRGLGQGLAEEGRSSLGIPDASPFPQGAEVLRASHPQSDGFIES